MGVDGASKKTFVVTPRNMDVLLDIDTRAPYDEKEDSQEELLLYQPQNSPIVTIMKLSKQEDRSYMFSYCEMTDNAPGAEDDEAIANFNEITLKPGQVRMIQVLCEASLPALTGMHAIFNP